MNPAQAGSGALALPGGERGRGEILLAAAGARQALAHLLDEAGYAVRLADRGEPALAAAIRQPPDLIVLDMGQAGDRHGMDGLEICQCLKQQPETAGIPVIFLSAVDDARERVMGFAAGAVDFIATPIEPGEALARIGTHIGMALTAKAVIRRHRAANRPPAAADTGTATAPREILIVEDTPESMQLLAENLTHAGYAVREAPNGELALWTATKRPPDLILLDIRMPGMSGFDVCRHLKADPATARIPVLFLSAFSDREYKQAGFAAGAVDFIVKPFSEQEILARVQSHLRLADGLREPACGVACISCAGGGPQDKNPPHDERRLVAIFAAVDEAASAELNDLGELGDLAFGALARGEMQLSYQPVFHLASGRLAGAEALLRWNNPRRGLLQPAQFLPALEANGEIVAVGAWTFATVCARIAAWHAVLAEGFDIAVNLSSLQFWQDGLPESVGQALADAGLPARRLTLEVALDTLQEDLPQGIATLRRLAAQGIGLTLDCCSPAMLEALDGGTLAQLPCNGLKLDFRHPALAEPGAAKMLDRLASVAHRLRIGIAASSVEEEWQWALACARGFDRAQGHWLGASATADEFCGKYLDGRR